jgi:hypothetical protein
MSSDLSPEKLLSLRILLDRLYYSGERCKAALVEVREGKMTREDYARILGEQIAAQRAWEEQHHAYHLVRD